MSTRGTAASGQEKGVPRTGVSAPLARPGRARRALPWAALVLALALDVVSAWRATAQPASDVRTYRQWITGPLPSWDLPGPYPLGADLLWWPLRWVERPDVNLWWLVGCTLPATLGACLVLRRTASRPLAAITVWLTMAGLLERSYWMRLEPVAALAALLMIAGVRRRRAAAPALVLSAGALVKVWPVFLAPTAVLLLTGVRSRVRWLVWFAVPWVAYAIAVLALRPAHATTWLTFTFRRRTQAESVSALPALWSMASGHHTWRMRYVGGLDSADIIIGPHLHASRWLLQGLGVVVLVLLAVRVVRWLRVVERSQVTVHRPADPRGGIDGERLAVVLCTQVAVLLVIVFAGPVFSPQYLVWFAAPLAVAVGEGWLGREVLVWLVGCALTFVEFPMLWLDMRKADPVAVAFLTARDAVLLVLLVLCLARIRRWTAPRLAAALDSHDVS